MAQQKDELVEFLDRKVFDPVLRASESGKSDEQKAKLEHLKDKTRTEKQRYHDYEDAAKVKRMFRDDLSSAPLEATTLTKPTAHGRGGGNAPSAARAALRTSGSESTSAASNRARAAASSPARTRRLPTTIDARPTRSELGWCARNSASATRASSSRPARARAMPRQ